ncbi:MAG TPA: type I methionyl aminopeptidase [Vicinamibacterales bacterium]|nr:type I methionyl aminopeptidase [Vicinamibacterales bacterium]
MSIDGAADFDGITRAGKVVAEALNAMVQATRAGITTHDLDSIGALVLKDHGARSAPQVVYGCPAVNLISINDEIVHGLPGGRVLRAGDVVKIDVTAETDGYIADAATTVVIPDASVEALHLRDCAISAFTAGLTAARAGRRVAEIGRAVEREVSARGFHVLRELSGHGVGRTIHEAPTVLNYFDPWQKDVLTEGLVLTIEPLISQRRTRAVEGEDGWTLRTRNGCLAAHHEHTIIVTNADPLIVTQL